MPIREPNNNYSMKLVLTEAYKDDEGNDFEELARIAMRRYGIVVFDIEGKERVIRSENCLDQLLESLR